MRSDEKKAILLIVKTAAQLKTDDINELSAVLGYAKESKLFTETVFGKRFIQRLEELKKKTDYEHKCILCGHPVTGIICNTCLEQLLPAVEKEYAGDISVEAKEESQNTSLYRDLEDKQKHIDEKMKCLINEFKKLGEVKK